MLFPERCCILHPLLKSENFRSGFQGKSATLSAMMTQMPLTTSFFGVQNSRGPVEGRKQFPTSCRGSHVFSSERGPLAGCVSMWGMTILNLDIEGLNHRMAWKGPLFC